jgi:3-hydroxyacyl-CoA dehydrogenase
MADVVRYDITDRVAVLTIDNPPVNALSPAVWEAIDQACSARTPTRADAIVLIGAGTTFIAGADIKVFDLLKTPQDSLTRSAGTHALLAAWRTRPSRSSPRFTATRSAAAWKSRCRVISGSPRGTRRSASRGAPGDHSRRRRHAAAAASGRRAARAPDVHRRQAGGGAARQDRGHGRRHRRGRPASGAIAFAKAKAAAHEIRKVREIAISAEEMKSGLEACAKMRESLAKNGQRDAGALRGGRCDRSRAAAGVRRRIDSRARAVRRLRRLDRIEGARHLFFAEREGREGARRPQGHADEDIKRAAVVGAGTMGGGIAMNYANAGIPVLLKDVDQAALDRGLATIRKNYESRCRRER